MALMALKMIAWTPMTGMTMAEEEVSTVTASLAIVVEGAVTVGTEDGVIVAEATDETTLPFLETCGFFCWPCPYQAARRLSLAIKKSTQALAICILASIQFQGA
jgi:hypothetical protein